MNTDPSFGDQPRQSVADDTASSVPPRYVARRAAPDATPAAPPPARYLTVTNLWPDRVAGVPRPQAPTPAPAMPAGPPRGAVSTGAPPVRLPLPPPPPPPEEAGGLTVGAAVPRAPRPIPAAPAPGTTAVVPESERPWFLATPTARTAASAAALPLPVVPAPAVTLPVAEAAAPAGRRARSLGRRIGLVAALGLVVAALLVVAFQQLWPSTRLFPGQRINGIPVGGLTTDEATATLAEAYAAYPILVTTTAGQSLFTLGLADPTDTTVAQAVAQAADYPRSSRWLPGTFLPRWNADLTVPIHPALTAADLSGLTLSSDPKDAALTVVGGTLQVTPAAPGWTLDDPDLVAKIDALTLSLAGATTLRVQPTLVPAAIGTDAVASLANVLTTSLGDGLTLTLGSQATVLDPATVLGLVGFTRDDAGASLRPTVDPAGLASALADFTADAERPPDGVTEGVSIDWDATAQAVITALTGAGGPVGIAATATNSTHPDTAYPDTFEGLRQELSDRFGSRAYAVSVIDLTDQGRDFSVNDSIVFTSASTYKIYVAYAMIHAVETGKATWNSPLNGTTLQTCFRRMIVNSDNDCPMAWNRAHGFDTLTAQARAIGASTQTNFHDGVMRTTAGDLATVLAALYRGELMNPANTALMIDTMKDQVYRQGIPTGLTERATVADKVGFLDALLHDAGIVYSDKGDYVLVVMTNQARWSDIAATASAVHARM